MFIYAHVIQNKAFYTKLLEITSLRTLLIKHPRDSQFLHTLLTLQDVRKKREHTYVIMAPNLLIGVLSKTTSHFVKKYLTPNINLLQQWQVVS